ncbi:MAG TPA: hypothetical protein VFZ84_20760 [Burkholderiales bacterium]
MRAEFRLVLHDNLADGYELSTVLLANAGFDGTLQLLTPGWERVLGFERRELNGKTLQQLMWSDGRSGAAAAEAILDTVHAGPVVVRLRCSDGLGKSFRLHRLHDRQEHMIYIVAEEMPQDLTGVIAGGAPGP